MPQWQATASSHFRISSSNSPTSPKNAPAQQSVFFFGSATDRTAFAADALRVSSMNLLPGGNQNHDMPDGWDPCGH